MSIPLRRKDAFTLVELLTVIGIIGILLAILLPVFSHARADSRKTRCAENLHQIWLATSLYKQDYDESYPRGVNADYHPTPDEMNDPFFYPIPMLQTVLLPFTKSKKVFECPSDVGNSGNRASDFMAFGTSYMGFPLIYAETDTCWDNLSELTYLSDSSGQWHSFVGADPFHVMDNSLRLDGHVVFGNSGSFALGRLFGGCRKRVSQ